jgi:hypothetical protein
MAEQFADFVERSAIPKQIRSQCVTEKMGAFADRIYARENQRPSHDRGDRGGARETANRSSMPEKHMTT